LHDDLVAGRHRGQALDPEKADAMVAPDVLALALVDVDLNLALLVVNRVEDLAARGGQSSIAVNDRREPKGKVEAAQFVQALDAERMWRDIDQDSADIGALDD